MTPRLQRRLARELTPVLAKPFDMGQLDHVNIRFHPYPPTDFAVGGRLLVERIPWLLKRAVAAPSRRERDHLAHGVPHLLALHRRVVMLHAFRRVSRNRARDEVVNVCLAR
jgi:hypothetical protein